MPEKTAAPQFPKLKLDGDWPARHIGSAIDILKRVASDIERGDSTFICIGIDFVIWDASDDDVCHQVAPKLKEAISDSLGPYFTFGAWLANMGHRHVNPRAARLAWIAMIVKQLEKHHESN